MFKGYIKFASSSDDQRQALWTNGNRADNKTNYYSDKTVEMIFTPDRDSIFAPAGDSLSSLFVFFSGVVYNRDELLKNANIEYDCDNAFLLGRLWRKWRHGCFQRIIGDWSCIIVDKSSGEILLAKDHFGISVLLFFQTEQGVYFSDNMEDMLRLLPSFKIEINHHSLISFLTNRNYYGINTFYRNIHQVPSSHYIKIKNTERKVHRYWLPFSGSEIYYKKDSDYYEHFNELFRRSIAERLKITSSHGVFLSSGIDSVSVAAYAAKILKVSNQQLAAFTGIPAYDLKAPDYLRLNEAQHAKLLGQLHDNIHFSTNDCKNISPLESALQAYASYLQPIFAAGNLYWIDAIFRQAKAKGIFTLLTGQHGNLTISWPFRNISKIERTNPLERISRRYYFMVKDLFLKKFKTAEYIDYYTENMLINQSLFSGPDKYSRRSSMYRSDTYLNKVLRHHYFNKRIYNQISLWYYFSQKYDIHITDPSADPRIAEFCFNIPHRLYYDDQMDRSFLRKSTYGILPDSLRLDTTFGFQSSDLYIRMKASTDEMYNLIDEFSANATISKYMEINKLRDMLAILSEDNGIFDKETYFKAQQLLKGIILGKFIQQF